MIKVRFAAALPEGSHCVVVLVPKDALAATAVPGDATLIRSAAAANRFEGEAGAVSEHHVSHASGAQRLLLVGDDREIGRIEREQVAATNVGFGHAIHLDSKPT